MATKILGSSGEGPSVQRSGGIRESIRTRLEPKFWARIEVTDDCWLWVGAMMPTGYGQMQLGPVGEQRHWMAHRLIYTLAIGEIPEGAHLHHKCHVRRCVRPAHLIPKNPSRHAIEHREERTECKKGHPWDAANTYSYTNPKTGRTRRGCKTCRAEAERRRWDALPAEKKEVALTKQMVARRKRTGAQKREWSR